MKLGFVLIFLSITVDCLAQQSKNARVATPYHATLVTRTVATSTNDRDTSRILFVNNSTGDSLAIYSLSGAAVQSFILSIKAIDQTSVSLTSTDHDSLLIRFDDATKRVLVGRDHYYLFGDHFKKLKQSVLSQHSVMAVLSLLQDHLGDYPSENVVSLLQLEPGIQNKFIRKATVITYRSQSDDVKDTWDCVYVYNNSGQLKSVIAASGEVVYFKKTVTYAAGGIKKIETYRNIEDRQITNSTLTYFDHKPMVEIQNRWWKQAKTARRISILG